MELRHLRYFVAVAEELNFTRAAKKLGINQAPLSAQIWQLERELGTPLFRRLARGVELTDAGKLLLEQSRIILKQVEDAATRRTLPRSGGNRTHYSWLKRLLFPSPHHQNTLRMQDALPES